MLVSYIAIVGSFLLLLFFFDILPKKGTIENLRDLNNQLINLGVSFSKGKNTINGDWDEIIESLGRPDLADVTNDVNQYTELINELLIVRDSLYGNMSTRKVSEGEIFAPLSEWYAGVGNAYEEASALYERQRQLQNQMVQQNQQSANAVVQNEERKQQSYLNTSKVYEKISRDTSLVGDGASFKQLFEPTNQASQEAERHFRELLADEKAIVSVTKQVDDSDVLEC